MIWTFLVAIYRIHKQRSHQFNIPVDTGSPTNAVHVQSIVLLTTPVQLESPDAQGTWIQFKPCIASSTAAEKQTAYILSKGQTFLLVG